GRGDAGGAHRADGARPAADGRELHGRAAHRPGRGLMGVTARAQRRVPRRAALLRREEILDASERVFAEKGYHEAGIADIAAELGIGHGTFYRYFKNKHDIALAVFDRVMARFAEIGLAEDPEQAETLDDYRAQVGRLLDRWLALGDSHPNVLRFFH